MQSSDHPIKLHLPSRCEYFGAQTFILEEEGWTYSLYGIGWRMRKLLEYEKYAPPIFKVNGVSVV